MNLKGEKKASNNEISEEQQRLCSENKRVSAHFSLRAVVLANKKPKLTIKFSVSPDTALKRHSKGTDTAAELSLLSES